MRVAALGAGLLAAACTGDPARSQTRRPPLASAGPTSAASRPAGESSAPAIAISLADIAPDLAEGLLRQFLADHGRRAQRPVAELIARLGSPAWQEREAAYRALIDIGPEAVGALTEATRHADPEVAARAERALATIREGGDLDGLSAALKTVAGAVEALREQPRASACPLLVRMMNEGPEGLRPRAARALAAAAAREATDLAALLRSSQLSKDQAVTVLAHLPGIEKPAGDAALDADLRALAPAARAYLAEMAGRKTAWTTGKIDKHIYGRKTHEYKSDPLGAMALPVAGVVYGLWGGQGEGDATNAPPFTVYVNGVKVGEIPGDYSGYVSPGPRLKEFDLRGLAPKGQACEGVFSVTLQAGSGGDAIIGEVKVYDKTGKDPGQITKFAAQ